MRLRVKMVVLAGMCTAMLAFAAPAFAASPAQNAYGGQGAEQNARTIQKGQSAQLPFTGLNAGLLTAVGFALLGGGLVIRRTVRTQ